jgi:FkbM family methyltransferase
MSQFNIETNFILPSFTRTGFFVEVGGNHPISFSNTFNLEKNGWKGIVIEPFTDFNELYANYRNNTILENCACVGKNHLSNTIKFIKTPEILGSGSTEFINLPYHHLSYTQGPEFEIPCYTLTNVLKKHNIKLIDFLSIDTEGYEHFVIDGIDFDYFHINFILLEHHGSPVYDYLNQPSDFNYLSNFGFELCNYTEPNQYLYKNLKLKNL